MKEHDHLDAWLQLAEQAIASSQSSAHITYSAAKDELRKFEVRSLSVKRDMSMVDLHVSLERNRKCEAGGINSSIWSNHKV